MTTIALFHDSDLITTVKRDLTRSIWADIEFVPEPLQVLKGVWPQEPLPVEVAQECVGALVKVLKQEADPQAEAVQALLLSPSSSGPVKSRDE